MQYTPYSTTNSLTTFAADYDCNTYGSGTYNNTSCATSTGGDSPTPNPSGGLADTGYNIIIPVALGLALIIAGIILIAKRLIRKKQSKNTL